MHWLAFLLALATTTTAIPPLKRHAQIWSLNERALQGGRGPLLKLRTPLNLAPSSLTVEQGCSRFVTVSPGQYCSLLASRNGISLGVLYSLNPSISSDCSNLMAGSAYCVKGPARPSTPVVVSPSPAPTPPPASVGYSGAATWFEAGLGACGSTVNGNRDLIVAVSSLLYDTFQGGSPGGNPNLNKICQKLMRVSYGSKSVVVRVQDRCEGCALNDVDLSIAAFLKLAPLSVGRMPIQWSWI